MSSPGIRHWLWWTWWTVLPQLVAMLEKPDLLPPGRQMVWHDLKWGRGLPDIIKGIEHSLECLQRRGTSRPAIVVVSYAGNDIFGNYGFIQCEWLNQEMACYSQKRRDAANNMIEERVNTHFSALNDLAKLSTRADVGNIVLVMPWYGRGYGLHPDFDRQMIREAEALRKRGLCVLDATSLIKCTTRYDGQHMENTEHNRLQSIPIPKRALSAIIFSGCDRASP